MCPTFFQEYVADGLLPIPIILDGLPLSQGFLIKATDTLDFISLSNSCCGFIQYRKAYVKKVIQTGHTPFTGGDDLRRN